MTPRFNLLPFIESTFKTNNASKLSPLSYTSGTEAVDVLFYESTNTFHFKENADKKRIILHFTAGPLSSDVAQLTPAVGQPNQFVSVPFVIARDGTIYQLFSSKHWAFNLGMKAADGNVDHIFERESIAIEISNYGVLIPAGDVLKTIYDKTGRPDIYCNKDQVEAYVKLPALYRKREYYATFTDIQQDAVVCLIRWLTDKYGIKKEFMEINDRFSCKASSQNFEGITSHVNYRKDGKWDIGSAFDWDGVITGVQAPPLLTTRSGRGTTRGTTKKSTEESGLKGKTRGTKYSKEKEERIVEYDPYKWEL
ncbi:MAG: N-acetylmuramoyl-L-alanine amidase [Saprospiraceae bacterium]